MKIRGEEDYRLRRGGGGEEKMRSGGEEMKRCIIDDH